MIKNRLLVGSIYSLFIGGLFALFSCYKEEKKNVFPSGGTPTRGTLTLSADESFQPVIQEQIKVFLSQNPDAKIKVVYKPESECIRDLLNDSAQMIIISRGLTSEEETLMQAKISYVPKFELVAYDALAVIVHPEAIKKRFKTEELRSLLKDDKEKRWQAVMDGTKATATVRYLLDEVVKRPFFSKEVLGAKNSKALIDYVALHPEAIGFVGVSWLMDEKDSQPLNFLKTISVAALKSTNSREEVFLQPYQANIISGSYPWIRPIYYVVKENYAGIGRGFANFMRYEKGQLIFKKAQLAPARMPFVIRKARLNAS